MTTPMTHREARLAELKTSLSSSPADVIGRLLRAGALARRSQVVGIERSQLSADLHGVGAPELSTALDPSRLRGVRAALLQADRARAHVFAIEDGEAVGRLVDAGDLEVGVALQEVLAFAGPEATL